MYVHTYSTLANLQNVHLTAQDHDKRPLWQGIQSEYTSAVSTRVSNALLVGEVLGQVVIGLAPPLQRLSAKGRANSAV